MAGTFTNSLDNARLERRRSYSDIRDDLLDDFRRVESLLPPDARVTRNFYRAHARYREVAWSYFWPRFNDFAKAATSIFVESAHDET